MFWFFSVFVSDICFFFSCLLNSRLNISRNKRQNQNVEKKKLRIVNHTIIKWVYFCWTNTETNRNSVITLILYCLFTWKLFFVVVVVYFFFILICRFFDITVIYHFENFSSRESQNEYERIYWLFAKIQENLPNGHENRHIYTDKHVHSYTWNRFES